MGLDSTQESVHDVGPVVLIRGLLKLGRWRKGGLRGEPGGCSTPWKRPEGGSPAGRLPHCREGYQKEARGRGRAAPGSLHRQRRETGEPGQLPPPPTALLVLSLVGTLRGSGKESGDTGARETGWACSRERGGSAVLALLQREPQGWSREALARIFTSFPVSPGPNPVGLAARACQHGDPSRLPAVQTPPTHEARGPNPEGQCEGAASTADGGLY